MLKFEEDLTARVSGALQPMLGIQVTVTAANGLLATLYADDESTVLPNPQTTDTNGYFGFKAANGEYELTFTGAQIETSKRKIELYDPDDDPPLTLAQAAVPTAASRIGFQLDGEASVPRTVENKLRDTFGAKDAGLLGDGTDETEKLQAFLDANAGSIAYLERNKVYGFIGTLAIPPNTILQTNGSTLRRLATDSSYGITVGEGVQADALRLRLVGGPTEGGISITGNDVQISRIKVASDFVDSANAAARYGLLVQGSSAAAKLTNVSIGRIIVSNFANPARIDKVDDSQFGMITANLYSTGVYLIDVSNTEFRGARITGLSPTSSGGPGANGLLIESSVDNGTNNLTFYNWRVEDSGEHAFRIGGYFRVSSMWFYGCASKNTGCIPGVSTGGAAFKVLQGNLQPTYHENINVVGFNAVDCSNSTAGLNNCAAFQIGKVKGGQFSNVTIRKSNNQYSCKFGFQVFSSEDIEINNPNITDCMRFAFQFIQPGVVAPPYPTTMRRVRVNGGQAQVIEVGGLAVCAKWIVEGGTFTDVSLSGVTLSGGYAAAVHDAPTGSGAYVDCKATINYRDPIATTGGPPVQNPNTVVVDYTGPWYGTFAPQAANGSIVRDLTNGIVKLRKSGNWLNQTSRMPVINTTANRPALGADDSGVMFYDTSLGTFGKPIWWRGNLWVDATGASV